MQNQEIGQLAQNLLNWFKQNAQQACKEQGEEVDQKAITSLRDELHMVKIPDYFIDYLKSVNGGLQLHEKYISLSLEQIIEDQEVNAVSGFWKYEYLTFAKDDEENYLILITDTGKVISWNNNEGIVDPIDDSLQSYIQRITTGLQNNQLNYSQEDGVVEQE